MKGYSNTSHQLSIHKMKLSFLSAQLILLPPVQEGVWSNGKQNIYKIIDPTVLNIVHCWGGRIFSNLNSEQCRSDIPMHSSQHQIQALGTITISLSYQKLKTISKNALLNGINSSNKIVLTSLTMFLIFRIRIHKRACTLRSQSYKWVCILKFLSQSK